MKEIAREAVIYQLVAAALALLAHHDSGFLSSLPSYLIITNCIAWSIRSLFAYASNHHGFLKWRRPLQIAFGLPAVAAGCFVGLLAASLIFQVFFHQSVLGGPLFLAIFKGSLPGALIVTALILSYYTIRERMASQALEQERLKGLRARAELAALQSKLNPHFLFNTLNTMIDLVHKEPDKVEEMILGLSDIYRKVLHLPAAERISLAEEFDLARQYLAIEQVRLGDRLRYDIDLPRALEARRVPPLLIQPLVENAVVHGITPKTGGGNLCLSAIEAEGFTRVVVEDDGVGIDSRKSGRDGALPVERSSGFGLHSARERLRLLYGGKGMLRIESPDSGGTRITLELPLAN
ncbi:MAG: histidine kinase [Candidatus Eisenbacteria bacterium]|nr:histidine kinase [Candidatus Eisenbacteria bacterium]